jgi:ketosteroid isomerase-like protein
VATHAPQEEQLMSAEQSIATVKAIYEAFGRGDVDAILERCTDDVDWASDAAIEVAPWHGVKHGKAEVPSFFAGIGQTGPVTEFTPLSFAGNADGDVMVFLRYAFTVTATGKDVATNLHHYWRFRDGKVAYYRGSEDTALIASALNA